MKKLFTLGIGIILLNAFALAETAADTMLIDSVYSYDYVSGWQIDYKDYYEYGSTDIHQSRTRYDAGDTTRTILTYRADGQSDVSVEQKLTGGVWTNVMKEVSAYNGNDDIVSVTRFYNNSGTQSWDELGVAESWTYDINGLLEENKVYNDEFNGTLILVDIYNNFVYDGVTGLVTSYHRMTNEDDGNPKEYSIFSFTYNEDGLQIEEVQVRDKDTFLPENVVPYKRETWEYDENGVNLNSVRFKVKKGEWAFNGVTLWDRTYENDLLFERIEIESKDSIAFDSISKTNYYYSSHSISGGTGIHEKMVFAQAYPNPASSYINLPEGNYRFQLINISGIVLREDSRVNIAILHVDKLPAGIYFLKLKDERHTEVQKILIR